MKSLALVDQQRVQADAGRDDANVACVGTRHGHQDRLNHVRRRADILQLTCNHVWASVADPFDHVVNLLVWFAVVKVKHDWVHVGYPVTQCFASRVVGACPLVHLLASADDMRRLHHSQADFAALGTRLLASRQNATNSPVVRTHATAVERLKRPISAQLCGRLTLHHLPTISTATLGALWMRNKRRTIAVHVFARAKEQRELTHIRVRMPVAIGSPIKVLGATG